MKGYKQNTEPLEFLLSKYKFDTNEIVQISTGQRYTAVLLKGGNIGVCANLGNKLGLIEKLAGCINDPNHQGYAFHSIRSMLKQRVVQIAASHEDANDCYTLHDDGILKICAGQEQSLAAQPTMCRM